MSPVLLFSIPSGGEWFILLALVFGILLLPTIFFILTLQNALKQVRPTLRQMSPGALWLLLIPLFNLIWRFIVVNRVADSLDSEYRARGLATIGKPGQKIGLAYSICGLLSLIPVIGFLAGLAGLVCWIVYWVTIAGHKDRLQVMHLPGNEGSEIFH